MNETDMRICAVSCGQQLANAMADVPDADWVAVYNAVKFLRDRAVEHFRDRAFAGNWLAEETLEAALRGMEQAAVARDEPVGCAHDFPMADPCRGRGIDTVRCRKCGVGVF
jgi:hypothetical protein